MWDELEPRVGLAIRDMALLWSVDVVAAKVSDGLMQVWTIEDAGELIGVICTEVYDTAAGLTCAMPIVQCDDMARAIDTVLDDVEAWARDQRCVRLEGMGRAGWDRTLRDRGWRHYATMIEKPLRAH